MIGPEFISLIDALNIIAECVQPTPFPLDRIPPSSPSYPFWSAKGPEIDEERKFSTAALLLSKALENAPNLPQWWEDDGRHPRKSTNGTKAGKEILNRAIDLHKTRQKERQDHLFVCLQDGVNPLEKTILFSVAKQEWQTGVPVGFDRSELIDFLDCHAIKHKFAHPDQFALAKNPGGENQNNSAVLDSQEKIKQYLGRNSWTTCREYMKEFGVERNKEAGRWLLTLEVADQITKKYPPKKPK